MSMTAPGDAPLHHAVRLCRVLPVIHGRHLLNAVLDLADARLEPRPSSGRPGGHESPLVFSPVLSSGTIVTGHRALSRTYWLTVPGTTDRVGGQHEELRLRLAGCLDDHLSGKPRRDADLSLPGFITEFMVDCGAQFRLDGGLLFPLGVHCAAGEAPDRAERQFIGGHRDEGRLPPAGFLCSEPQRRRGCIRAVHSYDNGQFTHLLACRSQLR
jgi:hypothetical protein